ncbi:integral membrane sensor signal transduction histidine kinase [Candidatus Nitrosoglobus terrae]|uniref:histidine kinase n=1 Tax=Candidatus Nitrosoglobus terrae TaxID=1630141 RepID=A0A1Q2SPR8_9GAMM|nr:HAMP domain-containing sensor histidine kinase [Candidatus Nitrosoglobus terrae]BAW81103.1 integral membrane sensor signal transduction histidine kinase [Candidatus Nitrosoglobus terrae]
MLHSLRSRLLALLALLVLAVSAAGILMLDLYQQSTVAKVGQANAEIGRACDTITMAYHAYSRQHEPLSLEGTHLRRDLTAIVLSSLRDWPGIEGGIWQAKAGSLAYAFPTYEGSGPKTDLPQAEISRIRAINKAALRKQQQASFQYVGSSQTVLFTACPLLGSAPDLTAWTMMRVFTLGGQAYRQLLLGLGVLFLTVIFTAILLAWLMITWSRHILIIEKILTTHDIAELPSLPITGELELDRIITALNEAGRRLAASHQQSKALTQQIASGQRLAAIGRIAAGVAHEIRNPIAVMQLKAENALAGNTERKNQALIAILEQIKKLELLLRRLLNITEHNKPNLKTVALGAFLEACVTAHVKRAAAKGILIHYHTHVKAGCFDPEQMRSALDNLILNAIVASPVGSQIIITATHLEANLIFSVNDQGLGPPPSISEHLFEPFVTGRHDGTGLGLSIVREVAESHGGIAELITSTGKTCFKITVPWQPS